MRLYAKTTSERASKGQGGNEYLYIDITFKDLETGEYKPLRRFHITLNKYGFPIIRMKSFQIKGKKKKGKKKKGKKKKGENDCTINCKTEHLCSGVNCKLEYKHDCE